MLEQLQKEWNELNKEEQELQMKKTAFIQKALSNGFALIDDSLVANDESWAIEWDLTYYDSYVGEKGALYDYLEGASAISDDDYQKLKNALEEKDEEEMAEVLCEAVGEDDYYFYGTIKKGSIQFSNDGSFKWTSTVKDEYFGDLCNGSYFEVKRMTKDEIDAVDYVCEKNSF